MLALAEMLVVFVLEEEITLGRQECLTAESRPKSLRDMVKIFKSATVTKSWKKFHEWNEVNPTSEKPKLGRGIPMRESNCCGNALICIDRWLS